MQPAGEEDRVATAGGGVHPLRGWSLPGPPLRPLQAGVRGSGAGSGRWCTSPARVVGTWSPFSCGWLIAYSRGLADLSRRSSLSGLSAVEGGDSKQW